ncbi:hypothetical protein NE236_42355 [Actinoallomurus purpureus]|uniref:hypothetical protein n=1 Tax=Actinoallomurus purpureus TaxID=478114 RepID=UPI002093ACF7|nr:hypothetical protein [Actinoallomurus purpureus]MCO6011614.1 hypothetical protein [Actinoallomurus purpureus]
MARNAMTEARRAVAPDGLPLRDGGVQVTAADGRSVHLPYERLHEAQDRLAARAADGATGERLRAEAARWLGEEIARSTGGHPAEGGLEALHRLVEHSPEARPVATELAHETLSAHPERTDLAADWPTSETRPEPSPVMRPGMHEPAAREIVHQAEELAAGLSTPVVPDPGAAQAPRTGPEGRPPGTVESAPDAAASTVPAPVRPAHLHDLTVGEIGSAAADLRRVTGWDWNPDTGTLQVRTGAGAVHEFHVSVGETDGAPARTRVGADGRTHEVTFAPWVMSKEAAQAAHLPPERVAEAADQLPRTLLHEVTDTLQRVSAREARAGQGMIRRFLEAIGPERHGDRSASGYNQHRYLADKWLHATKPVERAHYVREINDLARDLRAEGRTPPSPPWVSGADGLLPAERPAASTTPEAARLAELTDQVGKVRESVRNDITALEERVAEHRRQADEAGKDVQSAFDKVTKTATERDHAAATRATDAVADGQAALDRQVRHTKIADGYEKALNEARNAQVSYDAARSCLEQLADRPDAFTAKATADAAVILARRGAEDLASYGHAMDRTVPPDAALPSAEITGLAHLNGLTGRTNELVEAAGSTSRFAPDALEKTLRASTHDLLSEGGVLVPLDEPGAFVRIQAEVTDLVEVKPVMEPSEIGSGGFAEGGHTHGATAAHTQTTVVSADSSKLVMLIPDGVHPILDGAKAVLKKFGPSVEVDVGRSRSVSGNGLQHGQPGAVVAIRNGDVRVLDGRVTYKVSVKPGHDIPETPVTRVTEGTRDDKPTMQLQLSNSFTGRDLPHSVQLPAGEGTGKMPHHAVVELKGLEKWHDDVVEAINREKGEVDPVTRDQLRNILTQEAKEHLAQMVNKPNGERRAIPGTDLAIRFEADLDVGKFVALHSSKADWLEKVDVGLLGTSGNQSFNVSRQVGGALPLPIDKLWGGAKDLMPGAHEVNVGISGKLNGSRGVTHAETVNVAGTSVAVSVERFVGRTQAELIQPGGVVVRAHLYSLSDNRSLGTVSADLGGMIRLSAKDAAEAGMPVDVAAVKVDESGAIVRNPDGSVATPEDHGPVAPSERKGIPAYIGDGDGQLRGSGSPVKDITGIGEVVTKAMPMLQELDLVPELDGNEMPIAPKHPDRLEFLHELANLRRLEDFPERFFDPHYDQLCQGGMGFELPNGYSATVGLRQHFDEFTDLGPDRSRNMIKLNIDSQSSSTGVNDSVAWSGGAGVSGSWKNFGDHQAGFDANLGGGGEVNRGHSVGRTDTAFVNHVGLKELKQLRVFEGKHEAYLEIRDRDHKLVGRFTADGTAKVAWPSEILPDAQARSAEVERLRSPEGIQPTPEKLAKKAYWEQVDAGPVLDDLSRKVPARVLSTEGAKAFLNSASIRGAKAKLLENGYETSVVVDPHGPRPRSYTIKAEIDRLGPSKVTDTHDAVTADVNLTVEGTATSSSHTNKGGHVGGSLGGGRHGADGSSVDGGADVSKSWSETTGESKNSSAGLERLDIQVGKDVGVHASAHLKITVTDDLTGKSWESSGDVGARLGVRENDMLQMHLDNEYHLPLDRMSDLVERLGNGSTELGPNRAVQVVGRYAEDLQAAIHSGAELPLLAKAHTPEFLGDLLEKVTGVGHDLTGTPEEHRLNEVATHARDLELAPVEAALPEAYEKGVGMSLYDDVSLDKSIHDAVLEAVEKNAPGALDRDPTLRQALSQMYEGERWEGPSDNMFDPWGARDDVRVVDEAGRSEMLTIRVKAEWNGRAVMYDKIPGKVAIFQAYTYKGHGWTKSVGHSLGGDVNATNGHAAGGSTNGSVGTGRSRSVTTSVGHEEIRLKRLMWTDADSPAANAAKAANETGKRSLLDDKTGMAQLVHPVKITVTAERVPLEPGQVKPPSAERPAPVPVEVHGTVGRTLPARMVRDAAEPGASAADHVPDHRPLKIGNDFAVERVEPEGIYHALRENSVDLLGKGSEWEVERRLQHELSALQRQGRVEQMMGEDGLRLRIKVGRHEVEAVIRMELSDPRIRDVGGAEISQVDRRDYTESSSASRSELFPPSRSVGVGGELGLGVKQSSGAQASRSISDGGGARFEHQVFVTTKEAHSGSFTAKYRMAIYRDGKFMREAVTHGGVNLTVAGHELAAARARQETVPLPEIPDGGAPAVGSGRREANAGWEPVELDPARPSAPLLRALIDARMDDRAVSIEVPGGPDGVRRYTALPDGTLRSDDDPWIDAGFADGFGRLHPSLAITADDHGIDLRRVFNQPGEGTFADKVRAVFTAQGVPIPPEAAAPVSLVPEAGGRPNPGHGEVTGEGSVGPTHGGGA